MKSKIFDFWLHCACSVNINSLVTQSEAVLSKYVHMRHIWHASLKQSHTLPQYTSTSLYINSQTARNPTGLFHFNVFFLLSSSLMLYLSACALWPLMDVFFSCIHDITTGCLYCSLCLLCFRHPHSPHLVSLCVFVYLCVIIAVRLLLRECVW